MKLEQREADLLFVSLEMMTTEFMLVCDSIFRHGGVADKSFRE